MIRFEPVRGRSVVSRREGAIVGRFDDFQFDLRTWHIFGYRLRPTHVFGKAGGVAAEDLDQVGRDVAFITTEERVEWTGAARNPEDGRAWASRYLGTNVISRDGASMGEVDDLVFDAATDRVVALIISGERIVELDAAVATGSAAVVIRDPARAVPLPEQQPHESADAWWARVREVTGGGGGASTP